MKLHEALDLPSLVGTRVVAGMPGLDRDIRGVHVIDIPEPSLYVTAGQVLLMTGYAWPRDERLQSRQVELLAGRGLVGLGLAVPHFFDRFADGTCIAAERCALTLLEIPWEVPFAEIVEDVHRAILIEQYRLIERSERIHRELTSAASEGATLDELARTLGRLIDRGVSFEDAEGHILASHQPGTASGEVAGSLSGHRCPIQLGGHVVGTVFIADAGAPLTELEYRAAEHAALVAALKIAHQRELTTLESRLGNAFVAALLEGTFDPTPQAIERARLSGFDPGGTYAVALFVLDDSLPIDRDAFLRRERLAQLLCRRMEDLHLAPLISVAHNQVAVVAPDGSVSKIWRPRECAGTAVIVGQAHEGLAGIRESYREALQLLPYGQRGQVRYFEKLIFPRVILGDAEARRLFLGTFFAALDADKHGESLKMTLLTYVGVGFQIRDTAQKLAIHPNTVRYRLDRASQLMEQSFDDPETRFRLQFASHLLDAVHNRAAENL
ncbi:MAG: PucR family transcriptional regulator ligand-binding domain-containing protein [bacterium]|nr:PucR family transcriptional regulator ligand-binding domain-containing protein [bacterium]